ncbi:MAG TPA: galactokinase [Gemmatimonadaceae bacterium]|jgi:galactokinase|nr:galactokinase [Gemmatimonadaceae bacterium]
MSTSPVEAFFKDTFGGRADRIASAPARVNLIGEHTDYNGGEVLPIGIDRRTYVAVRMRESGGESRAASATQGGVGIFDAANAVRSGEWWDYVAGVTRDLSASGVVMPALEIAIASDVPSGAGLSSSAAIAVAAALAIGDMLGESMPLQRAADTAWRAESSFVGVPCGIMDQFASALAEERSALHVWCDTMRTEHVRCDEHVLIFDTGVSRGLRHSAFATRRDECARTLAELQRRRPTLDRLAHATMADIDDSELNDVLRKRATHVVRENERVKLAVAALTSNGTIPGELLLASHASLRDLYECSSRELDWVVEHAVREPGVRGARLTGAGWGGCAIATGSADALSAAAEPLRSAYAHQFPHEPRTWLVRPAMGARIES